MVYRRSEGGRTLSSSLRDRTPSTPESVPEAQPQNAFRNDGSFLEMFKRMQEANAGQSSTAPDTSSEPQLPPPKISIKSEDLRSTSASSSHTAVFSMSTCGNTSSGDEGPKEPTKRAPLVGKRRGGRILPTGVVKKKRTVEGGGEEKPKDAWSLYMAEVKRYKETSCEEDGKTRPLVK